QIKAEGGIIGVPTFSDLDRQYLSGLRAGDLVLLAARPGVGKTSMAINIAQQAASKHGKTVAVFSLEMPKEQLVQRILCSEARVDSDRVRKGMASKQDLRRLAKAVNILSGAELYINDTMKVSISDIRSQCRKLKLDHGLDLVVIDYVQLMQGTPGRRTENRQLEVADISRSLKAMAKELDVPVLALSQLSRLAEQKNEEPNLSHLRESGALEQDADVVILLHRPRKTEEDEDMEEQLKRNKHSETIEVIVAKHRNGPAGRLTMNFIKEFTLFTDFAQDWVGGSASLTPPPETVIPPPPQDDEAPF
ncbi:MAG: AAA family ATPase, partial [Clostridia bacterium]|nr:AAA family ATPase [Clostridia bacterium]